MFLDPLTRRKSFPLRLSCFVAVMALVSAGCATPRPPRMTQPAPSFQNALTTDVPVSLGILLDTSSSMTKDTRMAWVKEALLVFISTLGAGDEAFLLTFGGQPRLVQPFTTSQDLLREQGDAVAKSMKNAATPSATETAAQAAFYALLLSPAGIFALPFAVGLDTYQASKWDFQGGAEAALYDGVLAGLETVAQGKNTRRGLVIISDGQESESVASFAHVLEKVKEAGVPIYSITFWEPAGLGSQVSALLSKTPEQERSPVKAFSEATGCSSFLLDVVKDKGGAFKIFTLALDQITQELGQVSFRSTGATYVYRTDLGAWAKQDS